MQNKILHLVQPGKIGDIVICLPIAKTYFDNGYEIKWYVNNQYAKLFDYVDYVNPTDHKETKNFFRGSKHFDEWKYNKAGINIDKKYELVFNRDKTREIELKKYLGIEKSTIYKIIHQTGSRGYYKFRVNGMVQKIIEVRPIKNFTIFDWYPILKEAEEIYCIDSCILNFVNQLDICKGKRYVRLWKHGSPLLSPILKKDWKFL